MQTTRKEFNICTGKNLKYAILLQLPPETMAFHKKQLSPNSAPKKIALANKSKHSGEMIYCGIENAKYDAMKSTIYTYFFLFRYNMGSSQS